MTDLSLRYVTRSPTVRLLTWCPGPQVLHTCPVEPGGFAGGTPASSDPVLCPALAGFAQVELTSPLETGSRS